MPYEERRSLHGRGRGPGETKFDKWVAEKFGDKGTNFIMAVAAVLGGVLALVLFMVVPTALAGLLARFVPLGAGAR